MHSVLVFIFHNIFYLASGLDRSFVKMTLATLASSLLALCAGGVGMAASCTTNHFEHASALVTLAILPMILFSGFLVNVKALFGWISWLKWLSPTRYAYQVVLRNELDGLVIPCPEELAATGNCQPFIGRDYLPQYNVSLDDVTGEIAFNIGMLLVFFASVMSLAYLGYWLSVRRSRDAQHRIILPPPQKVATATLGA